MDSPRYPGPPWRPFVALALTGASFYYFTSVWKRHALPLQAAYMGDYLRISVGADALPIKYTLIYAGNRLAIPTDEGTLVKRDGYRQKTLPVTLTSCFVSALNPPTRLRLMS
jgi:hypothetical protein